MRASRTRLGARGLVVLAAVWLSGCGYGALQKQDAQVESAWSEVISQYQQRAALVPGLVDIVKGYALQEQSLLDGVSAAEAKVRSIPVSSRLIDDPRSLGQLQGAEDGLTAAISRLLAIADKYPDLKADQNFRDAEALLESAEGRIAAARRNYADAAHQYNHTVRSFPERLTASMFGYTPKADLAGGSEPIPQRP